MAIPPLIMALIVIAGLGSSIPVLICTMGFIEATRVFRLARAVGMEIAAFDYVDVARARGESAWWIMRREILPNTVAPLAAELGLRFTFAILFLSALSFLGLGIQPPDADWGSMVKENLQGLMLGSWAAIYPAAAISLLTICVNYLVDWSLARSNRNISEEMI
jgi:peptide/nickel transport system permease protein